MAVNAIFEEIGSIKKIAPIFQTPAMGFEGDDFFEDDDLSDGILECEELDAVVVVRGDTG